MLAYTEKVGNQKVRYFSTSSNYSASDASALTSEMKKDKNSILSLKCCTAALKPNSITLSSSRLRYPAR